VAGNEDAIMGAQQIQGKSISYNNLLDLDAAWNIACALPDTGATIIKHLNPCGVGVIPGDLNKAYARALQSDPVSAFGGIVALNDEVDRNLAQSMTEIFLEIIAAPSFTDEALEVLSAKKNLRVLKMPEIDRDKSLFPWSFRTVGGGIVAQDYDEEADSDDAFRVVSKRQPTDEEFTALKLMWAVCRYVKSNAIVCGDAHGTTSVGMGQTSRVDAVKLCAMKAHMSLSGSVAASDAFFPFRDGVDALAGFGITAVIQPGGSIRDQEVIDAIDDLGMAMVCTGKRHFRH
jgi:phosphoribosylaminoimidazolecarboxamide formyltransferase/IMP cyclohydrolase